jgi:hypothetical protein
MKNENEKQSKFKVIISKLHEKIKYFLTKIAISYYNEHEMVLHVDTSNTQYMTYNSGKRLLNT